MTNRYLPMLVVLSLIWGSSFMFIKIADRELDPATLVLGRLAVASVVLAVFVCASLGSRTTLAALRRHAPGLVLVGLVNTAFPFWLLTWGETRIDSGLASVIQASVPIFNVLLALAFFHDQRVGSRLVVGVAIGFVGVALLLGAQPHGKVLGAVAVVGMAVCYAAGGLMSKRFLAKAPPPVVALGTSAVAALALLPLGAVRAPGDVPGWKSLGSVAFLGVFGTAVAYLLFFTIIGGAGAMYASFVTYLVPPVALAYGALFLSEHIGGADLGGLALILGGVALGTLGSRRPGRPVAPVSAAAADP